MTPSPCSSRGHRAAGRGRPTHPPGRGARARRGPGGDGAGLAGPARGCATRTGSTPGSTGSPSTPASTLRVAAGDASIEVELTPDRCPDRRRRLRRARRPRARSTRARGGSTRSSARSSSLHYLPRDAAAGDGGRRWGSRSGPRSPACIGRSRRCAPRDRPTELGRPSRRRRADRMTTPRPLRARTARRCSRTCRAADARLPRRHPRPDRRTRQRPALDLPRKVAPHVCRPRAAGRRAARPVRSRSASSCSYWPWSLPSRSSWAASSAACRRRSGSRATVRSCTRPHGDIFVVDPVSGKSVAIVAGPDMDFDPVFSLDGTPPRVSPRGFRDDWRVRPGRKGRRERRSRRGPRFPG